MDQEKIRTVVEWEAPDSVKGVQAFLGFCEFLSVIYRRLFKTHTSINRPYKKVREILLVR